MEMISPNFTKKAERINSKIHRRKLLTDFDLHDMGTEIENGRQYLNVKLDL